MHSPKPQDGDSTTGSRISLSGLEVRPFPYQQEMLDELDVERDVHGRHRNLVVAATGTGKTVVAALDYRRLCEPTPTDTPVACSSSPTARRSSSSRCGPTEKSSPTDTFGELYVGGARPERWDHVFASVQSLQSYGVTNIAADAYDIVVIDEFHHAEAPTYRRLLDHLTPRELLGLTATPERADGIDVRAEFFDGRTASRAAVCGTRSGKDLLCPFHYFAVADGTDLRRISWTRGRYDEARAVERLHRQPARAPPSCSSNCATRSSIPGAMRALGFCVSVAHARLHGPDLQRRRHPCTRGQRRHTRG